MAHNIATIHGRPAIAYQGATPWHELGTPFEPGIDLAAALDAASLNWTATLEPLYVRDGETYRAVENRKAVVREGDRTILSTVSPSYAPIQYPNAFGVFASVVEKHGLAIETAGALGNGEKAWMLFRLPASITPIPGDAIDGYAVAIAGHDGKTMYEFRPTPIRVVCQNTLNVAIGAGGCKGRVFGIAHIGNVDEQVAQVGQVVDNLLEAIKTTGETFAALARRRMTPAEVTAFIERVFPNTDSTRPVTPQLAEKRAVVTDLVWHGEGAALAMSATNGHPNPWAVYNAVTGYIDHVATGKAKTRSSHAVRMANASALFGRGADTKMLALHVAEQMISQ